MDAASRLGCGYLDTKIILHPVKHSTENAKPPTMIAASHTPMGTSTRVPIDHKAHLRAAKTKPSAGLPSDSSPFIPFPSFCILSFPLSHCAAGPELPLQRAKTMNTASSPAQRRPSPPHHDRSRLGEWLAKAILLD